jgi:hypothetical protein
VDANTGLVEIGPSDTGRLELSGDLAAGGTFSAAAEGGEIRVRAEAPRGAAAPPLQLRLLVPPGTPLRVTTFDAAVRVAGHAGPLDVASTSGDIVAEGVTGVAVLRTGRGDVRVTGGAGEFHVLGEHGVLTLDGVAGEVWASTIMGAISWSGPAGEADAVHLETDHGPVEARLGPSANIQVSAATTSGDVACPFAGAPSPRACAAALGTGASALTIRTVSGAITIRAAP